MTLSRNPRTAAQRRWRRSARAALVDQFGAFCGAGGIGGCGANGGTRLEFAHKAPALRPWSGGSTDVTLRSVRAQPFLFVLLCRPCHRDHDGGNWKGGRYYARG